MANKRTKPPKAEVSYVAKQHTGTAKQVSRKRASKRPAIGRKRIRRLPRSFRMRRTTTVLLLLTAGLLCWVAAVYLYVQYSSNVEQPLARQTDTIDSRRAFDARYGSEADRLREISFAAGVDSELQQYVLRDYTALKKNCFVNGAYVDVPRYTVDIVVRGQFARVVRDCGGKVPALIVRTERGWVEVFSGNTNPSCDLINQFSIPRRIAATCSFEGKVYTNPNTM